MDRAHLVFLSLRTESDWLGGASASGMLNALAAAHRERTNHRPRWGNLGAQIRKPARAVSTLQL